MTLAGFPIDGHKCGCEVDLISRFLFGAIKGPKMYTFHQSQSCGKQDLKCKILFNKTQLIHHQSKDKLSGISPKQAWIGNVPDQSHD
jgi:hypothetical protein